MDNIRIFLSYKVKIYSGYHDWFPSDPKNLFYKYFVLALVNWCKKYEFSDRIY